MPELPSDDRFDHGPFDPDRPAGDRIAMHMAALRDAAESAFIPPPIERLRNRRRRLTRRRTGIIALVLTALAGVGGTTLAVADRGPDHIPRPVPTVAVSSPPAPSTSSDTSPSSTTPAKTASSTSSQPDIRAVNWTRATIVLPADPDDAYCPTGRITTTGETTTVGTKTFHIGDALAHGDLTGDGSPEAVVYVLCESAVDGSGDGSGQLLVISWRNGAWTGLDYVGPLGQNYPAARVTGQRLIATIDQRYGDSQQTRTYRWNGQRFTQIDGPTTFPSPSN